MLVDVLGCSLQVKVASKPQTRGNPASVDKALESWRQRPEGVISCTFGFEVPSCVSDAHTRRSQARSAGQWLFDCMHNA